MDDLQTRMARLKFRAWHRGTREADYLMGCFFDTHHKNWTDADVAWFEDLLEEDDADVMAWAMGTAVVPERFDGGLMGAMQKLDYVEVPR